MSLKVQCSESSSEIFSIKEQKKPMEIQEAEISTINYKQMKCWKLILPGVSTKNKGEHNRSTKLEKP